jgi:hypothetical protein
MPGAVFVLPPVLPVHSLAASLAHLRDRRGGGGKVVWRRWHRLRLRNGEPIKAGHGN